MKHRARQGMTLIEVMISVAILGIGAASIWGNFGHYERVSRRAIAVEGLARVLDLEMEHFRACTDGACAERLAVASSAALEASGWARAIVKRSISSGPDGTTEVRIHAEMPELRLEAALSGLLWVPR